MNNDFDWDVDNMVDIKEEPTPTTGVDIKVTEVITNKVHVVSFKDNICGDLVEYALTHPNCVIGQKCTWRCTNYHPEFTVNMFRRNKWVLTTKVDDVGRVAQLVEETYKVRPYKIKVVNKTMIFFA